ncbi:flavodoxin family protein [Nocardia arizonensis]|uniref:flavodoxin family protein n=1 Tax=Nocardia arizonensis TaxID=1141647 RepID=UPI0006D0C43C|nr:flavodoxin domain-containing protein [Nocardia arizonensis]
MRARIVYESVFGNTRAVAEAIAEGLREQAEVELLEVGTATESADRPIDLLVVGGPTHAFGLSRPRTRADAAARSDTPVAVETGVREWLASATPAPKGARAAAFGTKSATPAWLPGSAARGVARRLRRLRYELAGAPVDFLVDGVEGPLVPGELERARAWGSQLAERESARSTRR